MGKIRMLIAFDKNNTKESRQKNVIEVKKRAQAKFDEK